MYLFFGIFLWTNTPSDTRVFTTTKLAVNIVTNADTNGWVVASTTNAGQFKPATTDKQTRVAGVVVVTDGSTTDNTINAIIATVGPGV